MFNSMPPRDSDDTNLAKQTLGDRKCKETTQKEFTITSKANLGRKAHLYYRQQLYHSFIINFIGVKSRASRIVAGCFVCKVYPT